mgnify:CR=1 FL=1
MTFYEAAVEILRRSGRPLHFKKITEVAIRSELLSHVGKTPESTMESRLEQEVKKPEGSWIVMTRPGVFTLREDVVDELNREALAREEEEKAKAAARKPAAVAEPQTNGASDDEADEEISADAETESTGGSRRRRRRRRGRGGDTDARSDDSAGDDDDTPETGELDDADDESDESDEEEAEAKNGRESGRRRGRGRRGRGRDKDKDKEADKPKTNGVQPGSYAELDGSRYDSIGEAAYAVLAANKRKTMTTAAVAKTVFDKKLVRFHTHDPEATIQSAMVTDNQVRARRGRRPLFAQYRDGRWGLTEWGVSDEGIEKERQILRLADELRREAVAQLGEAVAGLKAEAFEMVVMTLLERLDYGNLKVSKRTSEGDTFFTADWRRGFSDLRVCVQIVADPEAQLDSDTIKELRETLNHYSAAEGIIVHLGEVTKEAVRESRDADAAKVTVIDRKAFVRLLVDEGIGVKTFSTPIVMVDNAFIDALQR